MENQYYKMMTKPNMLIPVLVFLFIIWGSGNRLLAWNEYSESGISENCFDENVYHSAYSNGYSLNYYSGISGAIPVANSPAFSANTLDEDAFADDGGTDDSDDDFNDKLQVILPLDNGGFFLLLLAGGYLLYVRRREKVKIER